ncbi:MAG TPA: hypothetical protein VFT43_01485, partial [Candidatus Polarisedimenticolia bacterium]|nr:hypothetical protein [Candidatus Polarisedimenticolia bacterium]
PVLTGGLAAAAALPGLRFPFLSDDWAQVEAAGSVWPPWHTPFADFRPLYMASLWLDRQIAGLSPAFFHLTNVMLIALAAFLVVVVVRRYTGDARIATGAGLLFALHPYHVENAAWIAARSDPLYAVPLLLAALAYDRWRDRRRGLPLAALALFESALLAKEMAIVLPVALILIGALDRKRRPDVGEWTRGLAPLLLLAVLHFALLRPWALGGPGRTLLGGFGSAWIAHGLGYAAAAILPADVEILTAHPVPWGAGALFVLGLLLVMARLRSGAIPRPALAAMPLFAVLLIPALVGFQERYLFLPSAASALALAALLRAARGRVAAGLSLVLASFLIAASVMQWSDWRQAALASDRLVEDLVRAGRRPGVREIVVANMPFRVRGGSVAGDFQAALALSDGRPLPVRAAAYISYASAGSDALDGTPGTALRSPPPFAEVWVRVPHAPFSHYVGPLPPGGGPGQEATQVLESATGTLVFDGRGGVRIRIPPSGDGGRAAYAWVGGRLRPLF